MKSLNVNSLLSFARSGGSKLSSQRLMQDKLSLGIVIPTAAINIITLLTLLVSLHPTDFAVPVRYSSLTGFEALGSWYEIYLLGLFGLLVTVTNTGLAIACYSRSRITSFFLLIGSFVVNLFCLIITLAFVAIV